eukprot:m.159127 g.159127  ORF g.159127 m.159127 type:complete len:382 (-) comp16346_c0_seq2:3316-4461(-)
MAAFHNRSCVHSWSARFEMKKFALLLVAIAATAITQAQLDASTGLFPIVEDVIPTFDVACSPVTHCIDAGYENLTAIAEGEASAFWRSPSTTARVNITMDLHGVHELVGFEMEMLRLPKTAVLLRSLDGQLFEPYQYYAYDCLSAFDRMPDVAPESTEEAVCVSSGSSPSDDHGFSFNPLDSKRPPTGSQRDYFNNDRLQAFVRLRYLRISFLAYHGPDTAVDVFGNPLQPLPFYEITSLRVLARCFCNGHASSCEIMTDANGNQQSMCACQHNTMGPECQMCQPLFNNRPYQLDSHGNTLQPNNSAMNNDDKWKVACTLWTCINDKFPAYQEFDEFSFLCFLGQPQTIFLLEWLFLRSLCALSLSQQHQLARCVHCMYMQ